MIHLSCLTAKSAASSIGPWLTRGVRLLRQLGALTLQCLFLVAAPALGQIITFDEFAADDNIQGPLDPTRYAALGVQVLATDDGSTWSGTTLGDPGNWGITGTNGPRFSGFNGASYALTMLFDSAVHAFSLDVSRSNGSAAGDMFTLQGYKSSVLVESHSVALGPINAWTTVSLASEVDETRWSGQGSAFHPFGIDNVRWTVPEPTAATLCIAARFRDEAKSIEVRVRAAAYLAPMRFVAHGILFALCA